MTTFRCPRCSTMIGGPDAPAFDCPGCGAPVRPPTGASAGPMQLGLFGEAVPMGTVQRARRSSAPAVLGTGRWQPMGDSHRDAIALITEMYNDGRTTEPEHVARARKSISAHATADVREIALGAAWMAAVWLRALDVVEPGYGRRMLADMGLTFADGGRRD